VNVNSVEPLGSDLGKLVSIRRLGHVLSLAPSVLRAVADDAGRSYRSFQKHSVKNGRLKVRQIDQPVGLLETVHERIEERILAKFPFPKGINGGVKGRSPTTNALPHVRQPEVVNVDIKNFFGSVTAKAVARAWKEQFGCGADVTWLLTRLTTYKGHLPQGARTSTALANLALLPVARELEAYARERGLHFSVFVDDISVSGAAAREMIDHIARKLGEYGFALSRHKTAVMKRGRRQTVTGIVVNRKLSNGAAKVHEIRRSAFEAIRSGKPGDLSRLRGMLAQSTAVCPSQGRRLRRLVDKLAVKEGDRQQ
jgi:RNA-directed DNA polymerase